MDILILGIILGICVCIKKLNLIEESDLQDVYTPIKNDNLIKDANAFRYYYNLCLKGE